MSEETNVTPGSPGTPPPTTPPPQASAVAAPIPREPASRGGGLALVLAVLALVLAVLLGWQWFEMKSRVEAMRRELAERLAEGDTLAKEARGLELFRSAHLAALGASIYAVLPIRTDAVVRILGR